MLRWNNINFCFWPNLLSNDNNHTTKWSVWWKDNSRIHFREEMGFTDLYEVILFYNISQLFHNFPLTASKTHSQLAIPPGIYWWIYLKSIISLMSRLVSCSRTSHSSSAKWNTSKAMRIFRTFSIWFSQSNHCWSEDLLGYFSRAMLTTWRKSTKLSCCTQEIRITVVY